MTRVYTEEQKARMKEIKRVYYQKNKDKFQQLNKEWVKENKEKDMKMKRDSYHNRKNDPINIIKAMFKHAKARCVKKGIEFSLSLDDIILPEICPILGVPFDRDTRRYSYSLDRKDPTKGYTKDNVWVISQIANAMKWDSTHQERLLFAKWVMSLEGGELP